MKKTSLFLSVAIALVSFASCQKNELSAPAEGTSFSMFAELTPLSKTTLDGYSVDWEMMTPSMSLPQAAMHGLLQRPLHMMRDVSILLLLLQTVHTRSTPFIVQRH